MLTLPCVLQDKVHPQTIAVLQSRADGLGLTVEVGDENTFNVDKDVSGVLVQYPATDGSVRDYKVRAAVIPFLGCDYYHLGVFHYVIDCLNFMDI